MDMNKPVAWMTDKGQIVHSWEKEKHEITYGDHCIPLYTHPHSEESVKVKELTLTDEDILEEWTCKYSDCYQDTLIDFARAILRKAQEK